MITLGNYEPRKKKIVCLGPTALSEYGLSAKVCFSLTDHIVMYGEVQANDTLSFKVKNEEYEDWTSCEYAIVSDIVKFMHLIRHLSTKCPLHVEITDHTRTLVLINLTLDNGSASSTTERFKQGRLGVVGKIHKDYKYLADKLIDLYKKDTEIIYDLDTGCYKDRTDLRLGYEEAIKYGLSGGVYSFACLIEIGLSYKRWTINNEEGTVDTITDIGKLMKLIRIVRMLDADLDILFTCNETCYVSRIYIDKDCKCIDFDKSVVIPDINVLPDRCKTELGKMLAILKNE
jgi:hypothetical protein